MSASPQFNFEILSENRKDIQGGGAVYKLLAISYKLCALSFVDF
jgi:hypothetical protein